MYCGTFFTSNENTALNQQATREVKRSENNMRNLGAEFPRGTLSVDFRIFSPEQQGQSTRC